MENYTQIAMQALLSNERNEDFIFLMETFKELCGGLMPQVKLSPAYCRVGRYTPNTSP